MKTIFEYLDYRQFLADYIEERKDRGISARAVSKRAGFKSPNYMQLIIEGRRNVSPASMAKLVDYFKFKGAEREFFEHLVLMNQAKTTEQKQYYFEKLSASKKYIALKHLEHDQYEYFSKWYYAAVRELVLLPDFSDDPEWIARTLTPNITMKAAHEAMELLLRLGLIRRIAKGRYEQVDRNIGTPAEIATMAAWKFHREMMQRSAESLDLINSRDRELSALTVAISRDDFEKAKRRIQEFHRKLHADLSESTKHESVYQLNIQFFPLSEVRHEK